MTEIYDECVKNKTFLLVDECFLEFTGKASFVHSSDFKTPPFRDLSYLIILRAFTKIYAMAGIRLGYCLCPNAVLRENLQRIRQCWSVSSVAQVAGIAALKVSREYIAQTQKIIAESRRYLEDNLVKLGFNVYPGDANYILFSFAQENRNLKEHLLEKGILIRDASDYVGLSKGDYRVAVRGMQDNRQLIRGLSEILK